MFLNLCEIIGLLEFDKSQMITVPASLTLVFLGQI